MKTGKSLSIFALMFLSIVIIFLACGGGGGGGDGDDGVVPDQLIYEFNLDGETKVNIGREGGEASLETASGIGITLSVPPNAVLDEQVFSLTPVTSIAGTPIGFYPVVAVGLGPTDQPFASPPKVTFDLPAGFRGNNLAVGFFTNSDGTEFYLTPLIGPDGALADNEVSEVSIITSSFSVAGGAVIDESYSYDQTPELSDIGKSAQNELSKIRADLIKRQQEDHNATYTELELQQIKVILNRWNQYLRDQLGLLLQAFEASDITDLTFKELLSILGERTVMEVNVQLFEVDISDIEGYLSAEELVTELETMIDAVYDASFDDCLTTDLEKIEKSEDLRFTLNIIRQLLGVEIIQLPEEIPCRFDVELSPEFTRLQDESEAAVVTAVFKPYDPRTGQILPALDGATFLLLGDFETNASSNVTLGVLSGNELRFLVEGRDVGTVTISGPRVLSPISAKAQIFDLTGIWVEILTPIENNCEGAELEEDPEPFYLSVTQSGDILQIEFPGGATANAKIENWNGEGPWEITTEQQSTSDTTECNAFFDDIEAWLGGLPPLNSCVPTFCQETQNMSGTLMEDLKTITGTVYWEFEYRADCTYSGEEPFNYTLSEKCEGVDEFIATMELPL